MKKTLFDLAHCKWMKIMLAWEKQYYLDDTQDAFIGLGVRSNFIVSVLIPFNDGVFGTPASSFRSVFVLYRDSQNIVHDHWF